MQQGTDLLTQLAAIRERQGKEPLPDPGFIQGFGPGHPSPPPPIIAPPAVMDPDEDEEPSPLIPPQEFFAGTKQRQAAPSIDPQIPTFKLVVMDNAAQYAGHGVMLQDGERDRIAEIIVKAVKRELDGEVATLGLREAQAQGLAPPIAKRKRGRPRKDATPTSANS